MRPPSERPRPPSRPAAPSAKSKADLKEHLASHPQLQALQEQFGAQLIACTPLDAPARIKPALKENTL
jgi:hypothetical protein